MNWVFAPYLGRIVVVFINDILVYFMTIEDHAKHLRIVVDTLKNEKLYGKLNKHEFWLTSISFLDHIIIGDRILVGPSNILAVNDWSVLKNVLKDRNFIILASYY